MRRKYIFKWRKHIKPSKYGVKIGVRISKRNKK